MSLTVVAFYLNFACMLRIREEVTVHTFVLLVLAIASAMGGIDY